MGQDDLMWGIDPEELYQKTRAEYKTEPDRIGKKMIRLFNEQYLPRQSTYNNRQFLQGQAKRRRDTGRFRETVIWNRPECNSSTILGNEL